MNFTKSVTNDPDLLKKFGRNLTDLALKGKLDPVIGREDEIRRIIRILSRRTKNNPILIGEPGVGKTAIVEGLAFRIIKGEVPEVLKEKDIFELSIASLIAGAKFQGEFEERLNAVIKKVKESNGEIILFVDEVHTLVGAGRTQGAIDASNILKPSLSRGEIRMIGATTLKEHREFIEKDAALERRLQQIIVSEPTEEETISILRGLRDRYEAYHGVRIHDNALVQATQLSARYIPNRFLPDKAIDLVDEACSTIKTEAESMPDQLALKVKKISQLKIEESALKKERDSESKKQLKLVQEKIQKLEPIVIEEKKIWEEEKKIIDNLRDAKNALDAAMIKYDRASTSANYEEAGKLHHDIIPKIEIKIKKLQEEVKKIKTIKEEVGQEAIAQIISKWTGIPITSLLKEEKDKLKSLSSELKKVIKGQDDAIASVTNAIQRSRLGIKDPSKPIGVFLFLGPTGVGKTELAKQLAKQLFNDEKQLVRIDMSEYSEKHSIARLIGSPPGYVGHDQGGQLTEAVRRKPFSIVLLDEIEKAHSDIYNVFLQLFDDGRMTDGLGKTIDFKNTIIIMTSNIGVEKIKKSSYIEAILNEELKLKFKPEFLNRIDEIIFFKNLDVKQIKEIALMKSEEFTNKLKEKNYNIFIDDMALNLIIERGFDATYGARPLQRFIAKNIESLVANKIIDEKLEKNKKYILSINGKKEFILGKKVMS